MQVGLGPGHIVLDGGPTSSRKGAEPPQFSAHICCGQTAGCIKMPLGMEVGLSPGDFVLYGYPALKFSAHVCYSYCDFVRTLHHRYWFAVVQVHVLFLEKKFNRTHCVPI